MKVRMNYVKLRYKHERHSSTIKLKYYFHLNDVDDYVINRIKSCDTAELMMYTVFRRSKRGILSMFCQVSHPLITNFYAIIMYSMA